MALPSQDRGMNLRYTQHEATTPALWPTWREPLEAHSLVTPHGPFAEACPTAWLVTLAEELGPDDVAGVQVFTGAALAAGSDLHYVPLRVPARPGGLHPGEARGRLPGPLKS